MRKPQITILTPLHPELDYRPVPEPTSPETTRVQEATQGGNGVYGSGRGEEGAPPEVPAPSPPSESPEPAPESPPSNSKGESGGTQQNVH